MNGQSGRKENTFTFVDRKSSVLPMTENTVGREVVSLPRTKRVQWFIQHLELPTMVLVRCTATLGTSAFLPLLDGEPLEHLWWFQSKCYRVRK
jgi:hypothetical protein